MSDNLLYFNFIIFAIYKEYLQNTAQTLPYFVKALKLTKKHIYGIIMSRLFILWGVFVYLDKYLKQLEDLRESNRTFGDIFRLMESMFCDEILGVEFTGGIETKTTYSEFFALCKSVAGDLSSRFPNQKGRCISIRMDNSVLWCACFFGVLMAGFKPVLINTRLDEESIKKAVMRTESICVLCDNDSQLDGYIEASTLKSNGIENPEWANEIILMTSGTTGEAKLIVYSGSAISAQVLTTLEIIDQCKSIMQNRQLDIKLLALLPFYHIFGLSAVFLWFTFFGRTLVFPTALDAESIRFACKRGEVTHFFAIPAVWTMAVRGLLSEAKKQGKEEKLRKGVKLSNKLQNICPKLGLFVARKLLFKDVRSQIFGESVCFCISGGGFLTDEAVEILNGIGYSMHVGYGMTETGITSVELSEKPKIRNKNTVGKPLTGVEYKIDENGLLWVKGDVLHFGEITDRGLLKRDPESFFCTQDNCKVDENGRWVLLGRQDDIIIGENGENLSPDMISLRLTPPPSKAFCVTGLEDDHGDKQPVVIIGLSEGATEYEKHVSANLVYNQIDNLPLTLRPRKVFVTTDEIPQNLGKVKRKLLSELIKNGEVKLSLINRTSDKDVSKMYDESFAKALGRVRKIYAEVLGVEADKIEDNSNFIYDLGGSSMGYYNLFAAVSKEFCVELKMDSQSPMFTPAEFAKAVLTPNQG